VILDEIQRVTGWDRFVRTVYEKYRDVELIITGSNSELLSAELGSNLAGRFIAFNILPCDFDEFLRLRGIEVRNRTQLGLERDRVDSLFREYLAFGGLPELLTIAAERARLTYLEGILSKVVLDDVIKRFSIRQATVIEQLMRYLLANAGCLTVNRRLAEFFKNEGYEIKPDTIALYIDCILRTFALFAVEKLDYKLSRVFSTRKKYYAVDTGLLALVRSPSPNQGVLLEHVVYLALRRRGVDVFFGALPNGIEIDFITRDRSGRYARYQVTTALSAENRRRELAPFSAGGSRFDKGADYLLCGDGEDETIRFEGVSVKRRNIIPWLLGL
jgi:predicted AAA+ superfamily ATPase